ncbi:hypothetical protein [Oceanidesulfovibrio marinus]|uniref:Uncharacterized protein n=1 Tax=Oceanidesulfovibrio marinus TaxID=370038 RepID=A0ABX6NE63_9BACT|nr:hypothetical protein [Oceanidesulfovibrio marinus]QJT07885.1 hypothetical protein E8L03_02615 [Oceanidesulfovibrio marinus]
MSSKPQDDATPTFIAVPYMHPAAAPAALAELPVPVRFFDPGLAPMEQTKAYYRPESLPLDTRAARGALRSMQEFGERFGKPGLLTAYAAHAGDAYHADPSQGVSEMAQLAEFVRGQGVIPDPAAAPDDAEAAERAAAQGCQLTLLLAWAAEERFLEISEATSNVNLLQQRLDAALDKTGEDDDEEEAFESLAMAGMAPGLDVETLDWRLAVEKMAYFLPTTTAFFSWDAHVAGELAERGLEPKPIENGAVKGLVEYAAPCWKLTGRSRLPEDAPWLAEERRLVLWTA